MNESASMTIQSEEALISPEKADHSAKEVPESNGFAKRDAVSSTSMPQQQKRAKPPSPPRFSSTKDTSASGSHAGAKLEQSQPESDRRDNKQPNAVPGDPQFAAGSFKMPPPVRVKGVSSGASTQEQRPEAKARSSEGTGCELCNYTDSCLAIRVGQV
jgi:hypothetical protein